MVLYWSEKKTLIEQKQKDDVTHTYVSMVFVVVKNEQYTGITYTVHLTISGRLTLKSLN